MPDEKYYSASGGEEKHIDYIELFCKYLAHWKLILCSVIVCLLIAFLYLRYTTPVYRVFSTIMLKDDEKGGGFDEMSALQSWGIMGASNNVDNEIEILKSWNLARVIVGELELYTSYKYKGRFVDDDLYKSSPIKVELDRVSLDTLSSVISMEIRLLEDGKLKIKGKQGKNEFEGIIDGLPGKLSIPAGMVSFSLSPDVLPDYDRVLSVSIRHPEDVAASFLGRLGVEPTSKTTSAIYLSISETNIDRGIDYLKKLIEVYNREALEEKNRVALNIDEFINERLSKIDMELGGVERGLEDYKKGKGIVDLKVNTQLSLQENSSYRKDLLALETQLRLVKFLEEYMKEDNARDRMVPTNVGIIDQALLDLIKEYNTTLMNRNKLLRSSSKTNPTVITLSQTIKELKEDLLASISGVYSGLMISWENLNKQVLLYNSRINDVPTQERELSERMRDEKVKTSLYTILSRKREENALTLVVPSNKAKVIDDAMASGPVSPKKMRIYLVALALGVCFPVGGIYLCDLLSIRIRNRKELEGLITAPVIGEVPKASDVGGVVVKDGVNNQMAEAFRAIRTNLQFLSKGAGSKVIIITSSMPGEGKTFVSINLSVSLALLNKKVLLMGVDIRKPMLAAELNLNAKIGLTGYLGGMENDVHKLIQPSGIRDNLHVMTSGIVPPNPAELLQSERLAEMIEALRREYDYIIMDSAPIGLVTDTLLMHSIADSTIYITRENYTLKKQLEWLNDIVDGQKLPSVSVVLNSVASNNLNYFGSGYGYGGYGEDVPVKSRK